MAQSRQLRWGLLSTARINQALIKPIQTSKRSILIAVGSRSPAKAAEYATTWGIPQYFSSYEELLEDPDIDIIYNSLPNSLHADWSINAMQHGKHVLCEKPMTTSLSDMDKLITVAKETEMIITEAFMYRHHPQTLLVKRLLDEGQIGKIQLIQGAFCYTNTRPNDVRFDPRLGGGCLWDVGCYPISYARYLTGKEPIEVYGHQILGKTGIDIFFAGQLSFPDDVVVQFECSFTSPFKAEMEITGEKGRLKIKVPFKPGMAEELLLDKNGQLKTIKVEGKQLYSGEVEDIENAIIHGKPPRISCSDSRGNIAAIEGLYKSVKLHKPIIL